METTIVRSFHSPITAQITAAKLEDAGIETFLFGEGSVGLSTIYNSPNGGIQLAVKKEEEQKALQCLFEFDEAYKKAAVCTKCGANDFEVVESDHVSNTISSFINRVLTGKSQQTSDYYRCRRCGNKTPELPQPPNDYYQKDLL